LFPKGGDESFAELGSLELGTGKSAEFGEVLRTEVGHFMLLPRRPQVHDGIVFWRVRLQQFELYAAAFARDVIPHDLASCS